MEQANQWWQEHQRNGDRDFPDFPNFPTAPNVKKTVKAMENAATGTVTAVLIGFGVVVLLVGVYFVRQMAPGVHARNSALDDPCVRAYMAALELNKGPAKTESENRLAEAAPSPPAAISTAIQRKAE